MKRVFVVIFMFVLIGVGHVQVNFDNVPSALTMNDLRPDCGDCNWQD